MNVAAVVILYHPEEKTAANILSYALNVKRLYIFDNTEKNNISADVLDKFKQLDHVLYFHDGENKGIAIRLNEAAKKAIEEGYEWLLTMDQDSYFTDSTLLNYFKCIADNLEKEQVAMFGVQFQDQLLSSKECTSVQTEHLITSGSMLNLKLFPEIGDFDEALFIDKVDHEYCLRAQLRHFKLIRFQNIFLHHSLGKITYGRSLKNFKRTPRVVHSPMRMYYIVRNYFYLKDKYKNLFPASFVEMKEELWIRSKNNFLYGKNRIQLIRYIIKGFADYKHDKMGKL
jgi:rhamnosyltransferase